MDQRLSAALLGGLLGSALLVLVWLVRPPVAAGPPVVDPTAGGPTVSSPPLMETADVYQAFRELGRTRSGGEEAELSVIRAGDLVLPTGWVVAADVFFFNLEPFSRPLPVGRHPVFLLRAEYAAGDAIAAAMIRAAPGDPVEWEPAVLAGDDPDALDPLSFVSYGVDSGSAAFASAEAVDRLEGGGEALWEAYADEVQGQMFPSEGDDRLVAEVVLDPAIGANVIAFSSGFGDGGYPAWFGLDADGDPLVLLTDFGILDAPDGP